MPLGPIEKAQELWRTVERRADQFGLVLLIAGLVLFPVLILLDAVGVLELFDSPAWWNLLGLAFMVAIGSAIFVQWLREQRSKRNISPKRDGAEP